MKHLVFDSWPVISFFENQQSAKDVEEIIKKCTSENGQMCLSVINLGEIWYTIARVYSDKQADLILREIQELTFRVYPANWMLTQIAAKYKSKGGISYADCFGAALAKHLDAPLLTGDKEFQRLESEIEIMWIE